MAEQQQIVVSPAVSPDAFLADRQRFWGAFTRFIVGVGAFTAVILILMALFLCSDRVGTARFNPRRFNSRGAGPEMPHFHSGPRSSQEIMTAAR